MAEMMEIAMKLITFGGDAKSSAMEAIQEVKKRNFSEADNKIVQAEQSLVEAHNAQTELLTQEAQGVKNEVSLLMVHSQDHLMTAITFKDMAKELIEVYRKIDQ
ncbi:PTS lactose/cellobiose transporter subunit IIA [Staphylococcus caeli]|uniref:PTS lactose/cellobiose transporter subunit IIA n=1 Tax=Staphylococcus caeli TaxID=2201815 RepID=UPI003F5527C2